MADYDNRIARAGSVTDVIDAGLRSYMLRVYNYMLAGLAVTGVSSYGLYLAAVTTNPANAAHLSNGQIAAIPGGLMLTSFGTLLFGPLMWVLLIGSFGLVMFLSFRINKMSLGAAQATYWGYAALVGLSIAGIFYVYTGASIATTFFVCAAMFAGMSLWGYTTKRDLTHFGSFLFMGLIGIVVAMLVNLFLHSPALQFAISAIGVVVFTGLTAWDTQRIKEMYWEGDGSVVAGKKAIMGALALYLDFLNLFLMMLQFMGVRRD